VPYDLLRYSVDPEGLATITLDDPASRNALSDDMLTELIRAFTESREDSSVRCIVLTSSGERVFSAGGNLARFQAEQPLLTKHLATAKYPELFLLMQKCEKPIICQAQGLVVGGAVSLMLSCDLVIARDDVQVQIPEVGIGLFPYFTAAILYRNIAPKHANELLLLGERISAETARDLGLINRVVASEKIDGAVRDWAMKLASLSTTPFRIGKHAMYRQRDMAFEDALEYMRQLLTIALSTEDLQEGVRAHYEKRAPQWTDG